MANTQPSQLIASPFPNVGEMPVSWGLGRKNRLAGNYKGIVDLDTGKLFSIVSKGYRIIRHEEAIAEMEEAISRTKDLGGYQVITEFTNNGGRMRRTYRFAGNAVEVKTRDPIYPELHLFNSYDKTWPFFILLGALRVVCENGLVFGQGLLYLRKRHIYQLGQINVAEEVGTALKRFNQQAREWKGWTEKKLTPRAYSKVLETMKLGIKAREKVKKRVSSEAKGVDPSGFPVITVWGFYNVLTWHITHNSVSLNHQVEMEDRLRAACLHLRG
jgi:hypothetical protein